MADLDSDASSTTSEAMLIVRPASSVKPDPLRYERSYSRRLLLQLSKSDKIRPPAGLKPLSEWYGEYEPPSLHPVNPSSNAGPNGRYAARDGQIGGRRERERDRGAASAGNQGDRYSNDRDSISRSASGATPATGAMGDFKLAGQRPFTLPKDSDSGDALSAGNRRRQNLRDTDLRDRSMDGKDRDWAAAGSNADRRRQLGGEFIKKDGRAAEEGGWRSSRETMQFGRDRLPRGDRLDRPDRSNYNDRDPRGPPASGNTDRRRQPAWMEDEEAAASPRHESSNAFQRRGQNGSHSHDASPAWMADEPSSAKGRPSKSLEELEFKQSTSQPTSEASHVDSIQAFKAQMKEMERRKKVQEEKELRREMGLPELPDEHYEKKADDKNKNKQGTSEKAQSTSAQSSQTAPPKSVFADFLLPSSTTKEKESIKASEDRPRSSRFARMFAADAAATQASDRASPAAPSAPSPSYGNGTIPQSSSSNSLLAALLPGASISPAPPTARSTSSPVPPPTQTDNQSMARLMEMLHMSSAPTNAQSASTKIANKPPGIALEGSANPQNKAGASPQATSHQSMSPAQKDLGPSRSGQHQVTQNATNFIASVTAQQPLTTQRKEAVSSPQPVSQSRLANRSSGYQASTANGESSVNQAGRRQDQMQAPVPPQPSVNLLDLLAGHATPPSVSQIPPSSRSIPPPQQQQQYPQQHQMRAHPMHSPPALGHFSPPGGPIPDHQHAQMAAFLQAQSSNAGRPLGPPGVPSAGNMQYARPPPGGYLPSQPQHGPPGPQHPHPGHMRSPSGHMPAPLLSQETSQRAPSHGHHQPQYMHSMRNDGPANQPLPPPQAFAQQNALAQLLAQGGHPGQQFGGMRSPPIGPPGYQQNQPLPPPPMHMHQNVPPMQGHQSPPPVQQNQIDLMALLTGGSHGGNFAGR